MRGGAGGVGCVACRVGRVRMVKWARACEKEGLLHDWGRRDVVLVSRTVESESFSLSYTFVQTCQICHVACKHVVKDTR